jgi:hypothetical protein
VVGWRAFCGWVEVGVGMEVPCLGCGDLSWIYSSEGRGESIG